MLLLVLPTYPYNAAQVSKCSSTKGVQKASGTVKGETGTRRVSKAELSTHAGDRENWQVDIWLHGWHGMATSLAFLPLGMGVIMPGPL